MTDKETTYPALAADQERAEVDWRALYVREKQAWEDAQARHQHLEAVLSGLGDIVVMLDADLRCCYANKRALERIERTAEQAMGQRMSELCPFLKGADYDDAVRTALQNQRQVEYTTKCQHDGTWWQIFINPGDAGLTLSFHDVSDIKAAEAIREGFESERQYILSEAHCLLWHAVIIDQGLPETLHWELRLTDADTAQRFLPVDRRAGESYQDAWYRSRLPEDQLACDRLATPAIRAGRNYAQQFRCRCADGSIRWLHEDVRVETIEPGKQWKAVAVCTDITDRKRLEAQLLQAQKMEGIGRLAGGIAHDFNNLLSVILGYAEMVEMELAADSDLLANVQNIQNAATRASKLTSQLLAFARRQVSTAKVIRPNDVIDAMRQIVKPIIREDIELVAMLGEDVGCVCADPTHIEQVFVNLIVNACDAMPNGGKIILQTDNAMLADHYLREDAPVAPGEYVLISISDTGMGMTEEVKARLFEPFFTTKGIGKGTGLGLATVYGIVKQSGGYIFPYSEVGKGTTMKVYLPRVDAPAPGEPDKIEEKRNLRGTETVLVVEDEDLVRELTVSTLRRNGYTILEAENGVKALRVAEAYDEEIALVLTDAIMPEMGGKELSQRLAVVRLQARLLYLSGYTEEVTSVHGVLPEGVAFLQKPFTSSDLLSKVRAVLEET